VVVEDLAVAKMVVADWGEVGVTVEMVLLEEGMKVADWGATVGETAGICHMS